MRTPHKAAFQCCRQKHSSTYMVGEAYGHVQGASLKLYAALLVRLLNSPITRTGKEMEIVLIVILIGLVPAAIANSKGRNFFLWWLYGSALFIVALPHALIIGPGGKKRKCPNCAESISTEAKVCPRCQREIPREPKKACVRCGNDIPQSASACPICSTPQPSASDYIPT
jgi:RNA polymerase subunit RPABC4/transcription elongation factor Spt4